MVQSDEACDERHAKQRHPSPQLPLPSPPGEQRNGQSTAHTKEELAYSLAQNRSLNCSCIESVSPHLLSTLSLPHCVLLLITSLSFSLLFFFPFFFTVILSRFTSFLLQSFSPHQTTIVRARGGEYRKRKMGAGNVFGMLYYRNKVVRLK